MQGNEYEKYRLQSVEKSINILNLFYDAEELGPAEVAAKMDMTRGTAFRFLTTLEMNGLLIRTSRAKYRLGLQLYSLGQLAYARFSLPDLSHPYLRRLTEVTGETTFLGISDGSTKVIYLDREVSTSTLRIDIRLGTRITAHHTSIGKSILAYQPEKFIQHYLETADFTPITQRTISDPQMLLIELEQIRRAGYSCDNEESEAGLICFGAPILDRGGQSIAAISVSGPASRMLENKVDILDALQDTARVISSQVV